jgi:hypothetical protein
MLVVIRDYLRTVALSGIEQARVLEGKGRQLLR